MLTEPSTLSGFKKKMRESPGEQQRLRVTVNFPPLEEHSYSREISYLILCLCHSGSRRTDTMRQITTDTNLLNYYHS